jgi:hypothetical protein
MLREFSPLDKMTLDHRLGHRSVPRLPGQRRSFMPLQKYRNKL